MEWNGHETKKIIKEIESILTVRCRVDAVHMLILNINIRLSHY